MRLSTPTAQTDPAPTAIRGNPSLGIVNMLGLRDNSTVSVTFRLMGSTRETLVVALTPKLSLPAPLPTQTDRKSTRLNSSHMSISYAVFCLKKKKSDDTAASADIREPVIGPPVPIADCERLRA